MTSHCHYGFRMAPSLSDATIESNDMTICPGLLIHYHNIGRFYKGPLQVTIDVRPYLAVESFPPLEVIRGTVPA